VELDISSAVKRKLFAKHSVTEEEILECFNNRDGNLLTDSREEHRTNPATQWFIADTDKGRTLKVIFIIHQDSGRVTIKSSFSPSATVIELYEKFK
jgi:hypothetical protein